MNINNNNNNNKTPSDKSFQQYLKEFEKLRLDMRYGMATWRDAVSLREKYHMPAVSIDSLRRGVLIYDEYSDGGWVRPPEYIENNVNNKDCNNYNNINNSKETTEILSNGNYSSEKVIGLLPEEINNPDVLLKAHGFNPVNFELISAKNSKWQVSNKESSSGSKILYSSKIVVKPITNGLDIEELGNYFANLEMPHEHKAGGYTNYQFGSESLVFCAYDLHYGRFSNNEITGEHYTLEEAERRMIESITYFSTKFKDRKFEEIVFPIGQDFFNSGFDGATTSSKHSQDNGADFQTIFKFGTEALIKIIDKLANIAPVKVIGVPGNHGYFEETAMFMIIDAYFRNDKRITVDLSSSYRKYHVFGNSLIGFTHGSEEKDRIWTIMQTEVPGYWAMTNAHVFLTGHIHHLKVEEKHGVDVWSVPACCGSDRWTTKNGYNSKSRMMTFIFDKNRGLIENHYYEF